VVFPITSTLKITSPFVTSFSPMSDLNNEMILESIYEDLQSEFPEYSEEQITPLVYQRFEELSY